MSDVSNKSVAVVGLGYVGLPLALAFGRVMKTIGFDLSDAKVAAYKSGVDPTGEMESDKFQAAKQIEYFTDPSCINVADFVVVAVPTPIDGARKPDLGPILGASRLVGQNLKKGAVVIFESTVYPGVTEEECVPVIEAESDLVCGTGFKVGYSPERINPGDKEHVLENIIKIVSGQDEDTLDKVAKLYEQVVEAGVCRASSIKVAEAAKVIENTQRDLNIALMNELAIIFDKVGIDTLEVLEAAGTKWNFLPFRPGLVGGHCIGVDPYYLTHKAQQLGYTPEVILAGRRINDGMGKYIAEQTVKKMMAQGMAVKNAKILIMGLTFKENCSDLRNSKVIDIVKELESYGATPVVFDPVVDGADAKGEYGLDLVNFDNISGVQAVVVAVAHNEIENLSLEDLKSRCTGENIPFIDVKGVFSPCTVGQAGFDLWRL